MHLSKLVHANLLSVESQGRHKYYQFARKEIAYVIEAIANLLPETKNTKDPFIENTSAIKQCRTCYDHLAGKVGVAMTDSFLQQKIIADGKDGFAITNKGRKWFLNFGIDVDLLQQQRRSFLRPCLDWSERRHHMAGSLAAAWLDQMLLSDWIRRTKNSRAIIITAKGQKELYTHLKI